MKHSESNFFSRYLPAIIMWVTPLLLVVPNAALSIMGQMAPLAAATNVVLPLGIYLLLMSYNRKTGRKVPAMLPLLILASFQIVLLFLYADGSIIGVDMFLNVVTTNSTEAMELLNNLLPAIGCVVLLYLPLLVAGCISWHQKWHVSHSTLARGRRAGRITTAIGGLMLILCFISIDRYRIDEDLFPVNVTANLINAVERSLLTGSYHHTSENFTYDAHSTAPAEEREVYLAVIGETSRADNWQLLGYDRFTTPYLAATPDSALARYGKVMSESNTTHKSVPMLLTTLDATTFDRGIYSSKSVITAFKEAGFRTTFVSLQRRNHSFIDFFGEEADTTIFLREPQPGVVNDSIYDVAAIPVIDSLLAAHPSGKLLIVLHLYGSHFNYVKRYPREEAYFLPDKADNAVPENRGQLINAYDNSLRQTDKVLHVLTERIDSLPCRAAMIFTSDHGEDIFDDNRNRFLHASPTPTFEQLHVPLLIYANTPYRRQRSAAWHTALRHQDDEISSSASFSHTLLNMAEIATPRYDASKSIMSTGFIPMTDHLYLNDRNRPETLHSAGFRRQDFERLHRLTAPKYSVH
jgi:glucan phosphoethanolaminetransferase (alkaline phosphatase superfamily)